MRVNTASRKWSRDLLTLGQKLGNTDGLLEHTRGKDLVCDIADTQELVAIVFDRRWVVELVAIVGESQESLVIHGNVGIFEGLRSRLDELNLAIHVMDEVVLLIRVLKHGLNSWVEGLDVLRLERDFGNLIGRSLGNASARRRAVESRLSRGWRALHGACLLRNWEVRSSKLLWVGWLNISGKVATVKQVWVGMLGVVVLDLEVVERILP